MVCIANCAFIGESTDGQAIDGMRNLWSVSGEHGEFEKLIDAWQIHEYETS